MPGMNYGGTGYSLQDLEKLQPRNRGRILVDALHHLETTLAIFRQQYDEAKLLLWQHADEQGASVIDGTEYEVVLGTSEGTTEWEYDLETLGKLGAFLEPEIVERALVPVPATVKVAKGELNKLAKRGGKIKEIIDAGCTKVQKGGGRKMEIRKRTI